MTSAHEELTMKIRRAYDAAGAPSLRTISRVINASPQTVSHVLSGKVCTWPKTADVLMALGVDNPQAEFLDVWRRASGEYAIAMTYTGDPSAPPPLPVEAAFRGGLPPWHQLTKDVADIKAMVEKIVLPVDHPFELELEAMILDTMQRSDVDGVDRQAAVADLVPQIVDMFRLRVG